MRDGEVVGIAAEFHKDAGKRLNLFSMTVVSESIHHDGKTYHHVDGYDVDWSKTYGCYVFHNSSSGIMSPVSGIYFLSGDIKVKEEPCTLVDARDKPPWRGKRTRIIRERNRTRRLRKLPKAFDMEGVDNLLEWLELNGIEAGASYCSECKDWLPEDADDLCDHVWWCSKTCLYSTPDERCSCSNREECDDRN